MLQLNTIGQVALETARIPVIGCAEGHSVMKDATCTGMMVTAFDHAFDNKYSEYDAPPTLWKKHINFYIDAKKQKQKVGLVIWLLCLKKCQ